MKRKIISLILVVVFSMSAFAGCSPDAKKSVVPVQKLERKPQLVVAMNPIIVFGDGTNNIVFNDVKNAVSSDRNAATLTSLSENTQWTWAYKQDEAWKKRGIYGLSKWRNGDYISADKLSAYSFTEDGSVSLMPYSLKSAKLTTYQGEEPASSGILLSVSGTEEESICYQIADNGTVALPGDKITAIASVGGVKTGFLAEDGTSRSAVVKFIINTRTVWEGQLNNSTAGNGVAVTEVYYNDITNIDVEAGDKFFISVKLDAQANGDADIGRIVDDTYNNTNIKANDASNTSKVESPVSDIPLMDGYDSHFGIVYPQNATITQKQIINRLKTGMVEVFDADVPIKSDSADGTAYELLIGNTNRSESAKAYRELTDYRANNAADFIIKMYGDKLVIAANTDYSLQLAVDYFLANYCKTDKDKIPSKLSYASRPKLSNITLAGANIGAYTIRTEKYPSIMTVRAAQKLADYVISVSGYSLKIAKDTETSQNEILVGLTTRSGISETVFKSESLDFRTGKKGNTYNNDDYNVFVDKTGTGTRLFIEAGSDYAANYATVKLVEYLEKNGRFTADDTLSGSYNKGSYDLIDNYGYMWGDEFFTSAGTTLSNKKWKVMEKSYTENNGPWYKKTDSYYLASLASLSDSDPNNDFGGPWLETDDPQYVQEGTTRNLAANAVIKNNLLVQTSKRADNGYSSSVICTDGRMEFRYGILETRIIAATANGNESCFWTRTKDGGSLVNEIDIFECFGDDKFKPNLHTWSDTHIDHGNMITLRNTVYPKDNEHFYDTFHYLALEWTPEYINMYLDGEIYLSQSITDATWDAFRETTYVILHNCAPPKTYADTGNPGNFLAGGNLNPMSAARLFDTNNDGKIDINDFCEEQSVDYVRLYQLNSRQYSLRAKK